MANNQQTQYLDHARIEMRHCLTDGLFVPAIHKSEDQKAKPLFLEIDTRDGWKITWRNYSMLDVADLNVFLAIHRIATDSRRGDLVEGEPKSKVGLSVLNELAMSGSATTQAFIFIETSLTELAKQIGIHDSGPNLKNIAHSLFRMSSVMVSFHHGNIANYFWQSQLLSVPKIADKYLVIGLNPQLTQAILSYPTTYVDMHEYRKLKGKVSKRLYVWLAAWAKPNNPRYIQLDALIPHVWGNDDVTGQDLRNKRRFLRQAIKEIDTVGKWQCVESAQSGLVRVVKPLFVK